MENWTIEDVMKLYAMICEDGKISEVVKDEE